MDGWVVDCHWVFFRGWPCSWGKKQNFGRMECIDHIWFGLVKSTLLTWARHWLVSFGHVPHSLFVSCLSPYPCVSYYLNGRINDLVCGTERWFLFFSLLWAGVFCVAAGHVYRMTAVLVSLTSLSLLPVHLSRL